MPPLVLIAAIGRNGAIGRGNQLPWHLRSDLQRFRANTMGRPVIMGRKTFEAIGRPLPGRHLVVLTGGGLKPEPGIDIVATLAEALARAAAIGRRMAAPETMVAGGATLYAQTIGHASRLDITMVDLEPAADAWFPPIDPDLWCETSREAGRRGPQDDAGFSFVSFERRPTRNLDSPSTVVL